MTRSDDPIEAFADMVRGVAAWMESTTAKVEKITAGLAGTLDEHRGEHVPPPSTPHDCSEIVLDAALSPGAVVMQTRLRCGTCGTLWAPVFLNGIHTGWTVTPVSSHLDARYMPVPGEALVSAERARRAAGRTPGTLRWRTGRPHVAAEREALLFEQASTGDRFIGEMINPEFAQWVTAARALALDHDFEGGYHAASASADAFRDHYVALLGLDERPDDVELRRLLAAEMARLTKAARDVADLSGPGHG